MAIEALDLLYVPSRDVKADLDFYRDVLGARVVFAIEAMGTRVAEVAISPPGPRLVLAHHLAGDAPVLLHRVSDLDRTLAQLGARGLRLEGRVELPLGPCATFRSPGGQRLVSTRSRAPRSTSTSSAVLTSNWRRADRLRRAHWTQASCPLAQRPCRGRVRACPFPPGWACGWRTTGAVPRHLSGGTVGSCHGSFNVNARRDSHD